MNSYNKIAIGYRLKKIRRALGFTQEKMVSFFKIGRANYSRIEKGDVSPSLEILYTLQTVFSVSMDWIISGFGDMFISENKGNEVMSKFDSDPYKGEIADLLIHIEKIPMLKHAILSFFYEYKTRHKKIIQNIFAESKEKIQTQNE